MKQIRDKKGMVKTFIREIEMFESPEPFILPQILSARWGTGVKYVDKTQILPGYLESRTKDLRASDQGFRTMISLTSTNI